jgi:hypothetical protein|tara:strand:+ start:8672 stop:8905 length:234 start_codon:yes stop_codon:yes gene_type:complete
MSRVNNTNQRVLRAISNSKGRFFGLYTKAGEALNAQLISETPSYITVYDRNMGVDRKLAKSSLEGVRIQGRSIGATV